MKRQVRFTKDRRERFLKAFAETGIVTLAAEIVGVSRARVYQVQKEDSGFAAGWAEAEERAADALEAEAWRRAVDGVREPVVSGGKLVLGDDGHPLAIRRYSDTLMLALLKARRPERFKDRAVVEHDIADGLADRLEAARQRALTLSEGASPMTQGVSATRLLMPAPTLAGKIEDC